jgi:hypothetical protein
MTLGRPLFVMLILAAVACDGRKGSASARRAYTPEFYTSHRIDAVVRDSSTGEPVADAVVLALWRQIDGHVERWGDRLFAVAEARTDENGRFTVNRWGPRHASPNAFIDKRSPELWVLRRGYLVAMFDETGRKLPAVPLDHLHDSDVPIRYVTLPPNKEPSFVRGARARAPEAGSRWHGSVLLLDRAADPQALANSLAAANPFARELDRRLSPAPHYWREWRGAVEALAPEKRMIVPSPPYALVDYVLTAR